MSDIKSISPCIWFEKEAEEAADYYVSIFPNSKLKETIVSHDAWPGGKPGDVVVVEFELMGQPYQALNGGPGEAFNDRISLSVTCKDQDEVDRYWHALTKDGGSEVMCGWLKDRYGVRWQIVPEIFYRLVRDENKERSQRVMQAMYQMVKFDVKKLEAAFAD